MTRDDFRTDLPVSRGQWRALALAALDRLGEKAPVSRMDATELLVRFRRGEDPAGDPAANGSAAPVASERRGRGARDVAAVLDQGAALRERRGSYATGWRCWGCGLFIEGPTVTCRHCGQLHGGIHHEGTASR